MEFKAIAAEVGVSESTISMWASGARKPSYKHAQCLARVLGLVEQWHPTGFTFEAAP